MTLQLHFPSKKFQAVGMAGTIIKISAWVLGLWLWATVLQYTPASIDLIILLLSAVPAIWLFWKSPEYGIIALMFFASGFLAANIVDIRLGFLGGFELRDILILLMFSMSFIKRLSSKNITVAFWPVGGLVLAFMLMVLFSLIYALVFEGVPSNWALGDLRILFFYSLFFITSWSITSKKALYNLVIGSFVIADIVAAIVLIQQQLGPDNLLLSSMHDSSWQIWAVAGATRVVPPGIVYIYFMMLISLGLTIFWRVSWQKSTFWIFHTCFLSLGLIYTFTRSAWVATGIALILLIILAFPSYKAYFFRGIVLIGASILFLVGTLGLANADNLSLENDATTGIFNRFTSIFTVEDTLETNSLQWRAFEIQEATKAIWEAPLTGVGLGNSYRPITVFQGETDGLWTHYDISYKRIDRFTRYVHSSYYAIAVKMGLPALLLLLSLIGIFILKSIVLHYRLPDSMAKGLSIAIAIGFVGLMQWSLLHAHFILASSTAVIGLMLGIVASIHYLYIKEPQNYTLF